MLFLKSSIKHDERTWKYMDATTSEAFSPSGGDKPATVFRLQPRHSLHAIFKPKTIAVIGATEQAGSVGRTLFWNLISHPFGGTVFPVTPRHRSILGIKAYPTLASLPEPVDLAIIATPAPTVPGLIAECVAADVKGAIILSAGFKETGAEGARLEQQILEQVRYSQLRIIGPNCLGVMSPLTGLNATFASAMARPGSVGFLSQSGALGTAVLDWSLSEHVGFSAFVSLGSMVDVGWGDLIDYLGSDPRTSCIVIYLETIGDARSFLSAAREVARRKPIIVLKAGRTQAAAHAASSHTGALTGSYDVFEAACRRSGMLSVDRIEDLFSLTEVFARQPRPQGPRLTIVTNAGGPGVLATDALLGAGGQLAELSPSTRDALDQVLPAAWSHGNPVDILGDASPERYARALEVVARDPNNDGLLVILTPQAMTDPTLVAEQVKQFATLTEKPILASWMGGAEVAGGQAILHRAGIPTFPYPDTAARVFAYLWHYTFNLRGIYETPLPFLERDKGELDRTQASSIIEAIRGQGRTLLTEVESKQLLATYGIPTVETRIARNEDEAVACAQAIGYPVVLKLLSETITHKSDVGGVQLNLSNADAVRRAYQNIANAVRTLAGARHFLGVTVEPMVLRSGYELILGSSLDPQFGPVLLFGSGGQLVEVYQDRACALPPLTTTLARRLMEQTRIFSALQGVRGRAPIDLTELGQLLVRFSYLVVEQRLVKEIDINPLLASPDGLLALDARVVLHDPQTREEDLPRLAIRPYPLQYVQPWTLSDGTAVTLRPIRPEDEPLMVKFHHTLSEESVYFRWLHMIKLDQRVAHERLVGICFIDYDREMALVAEHTDPRTGEPAILGVGRLIKNRWSDAAEFAVLIADQYQHRGLGTELLRRLIQVGRDEHLRRITGDILAENLGMQRVCRQLGFHLQYSHADEVMKAELEL
jgi:acetyltransferase